MCTHWSLTQVKTCELKTFFFLKKRFGKLLWRLFRLTDIRTSFLISSIPENKVKLHVYMEVFDPVINLAFLHAYTKSKIQFNKKKNQVLERQKKKEADCYNSSV